MVGARTLISDDPALTVRHVPGRDPIRVILDSELLTPRTATVLNLDSEAPTLIFHAPDADPQRREDLLDQGAQLFEVQRTERGLDLREVLRELARRDVMRLLVEGGPTLHGSFLAEGLADYAAIFVAPRILGDAEARPLALIGAQPSMSQAFSLEAPKMRRFGDDVLIEGPIRAPQAPVSELALI